MPLVRTPPVSLKVPVEPMAPVTVEPMPPIAPSTPVEDEPMTAREVPGPHMEAHIEAGPMDQALDGVAIEPSGPVAAEPDTRATPVAAWKPLPYCQARRSNGSGLQCGKFAVKGMRVCIKHGGASPQAKKKVKDRMREFVETNIDILFALTKTADKDSVRLNAMRTLMDRCGLGPTSGVELSGPDGEALEEKFPYHLLSLETRRLIVQDIRRAVQTGAASEQLGHEIDYEESRAEAFIGNYGAGTESTAPGNDRNQLYLNGVPSHLECQSSGAVSDDDDDIEDAEFVL